MADGDLVAVGDEKTAHRALNEFLQFRQRKERNLDDGTYSEIGSGQAVKNDKGKGTHNMLRFLLWLIAIKLTISVPWNFARLVGELFGKREGE